MEVVVMTVAISRAKLQSNHLRQQINTQLFTGQMPVLSTNQQCQIKVLKGIISHSMDLLTPSSPGGLPTLSLTTKSSWLPWGWLPCLSSALWCQYPNFKGFQLYQFIFPVTIGKVTSYEYPSKSVIDWCISRCQLDNLKAQTAHNDHTLSLSLCFNGHFFQVKLG